ncbi:PIG-L family deacetylase [Deinococcus sp.]|uniref:PIG-L family deacetylase n=1 Tax=Deinococcus sp. TaxID=47478 RepID=UPI003B58F5F7
MRRLNLTGRGRLAFLAAAKFTSDQRILILAPHPDDETLCCAGMIQQAQQAGAAV